MKQSQQALIEQPQIDNFIKEKELLNKIRVNSYIRKIPIIDEVIGDFISVLCLLHQPGHILEIGCGTGYSTYFLLKNLNHNFKYTGIDLNKERLSEAKKFINTVFKSIESFSGELNFINGNAIKIIPELREKFDLVFIDAAKYEYLEYIKSFKEKLNKGAIIIADNIFYKNKIFNKSTSKHDYNSIMGLRGYIELITRSDSFKNYFFSIGDGIAVSEYNGIFKKIRLSKER